MACPFYGFNTLVDMKAMVCQNGNACALVTGSFSPCMMEMREQEVDWNECPYRHENGPGFLAVAEKFRVHPGHYGTMQSPPEGIPFPQWMEHVMSGPRPTLS